MDVKVQISSYREFPALPPRGPLPRERHSPHGQFEAALQHVHAYFLPTPSSLDRYVFPLLFRRVGWCGFAVDAR